MPTTTVGQNVWYLTWDNKAGPFPARVIRAGDVPLLAVDLPECSARYQPSHWLTEDGTDDGRMEIPVDGVIPADLFA